MRLVDFSTLPFWRGVASRPGVTDALPFRLVVNDLGLIVQDAGDELRSAIAGAYARPDYVFITPPPGSSQWADKLGKSKVESLVSVCGPLDGLSVLEIGAGNLTIANALLDMFRITQYVAVDPTLPKIQPEDQQGLLRSISSFFPTEVLVGSTFDLVIALNCLEHVNDAVQFLKAIKRHLTSGTGRVFLTFPDVSTMLANGDLNALVHEHISYFDRSGFQCVAREAGFEISALDTKNGLFSALLEQTELPFDWPLLAVRPEQELIRSAYQRVVRDLGETIRLALKSGRKIGFHGACPGLNNFLWATGLGDDRNILIADGDQTKWNRFVPACPMPILRPDDPKYLAADQIYIAATNFISEISSELRNREVAPERIASLIAS